MAERLIYARGHVPFVQANLLASGSDDPADVAAWRTHLRQSGRRTVAGLCQWFHSEDPRLESAVRMMRQLGVTYVRTGLSWADSLRPGTQPWFDRQMRALESFDVTLTFCFTPASEGVRPDHTSPPRDVRRFAEFCATQVRRYV